MGKVNRYETRKLWNYAVDSCCQSINNTVSDEEYKNKKTVFHDMINRLVPVDVPKRKLHKTEVRIHFHKYKDVFEQTVVDVALQNEKYMIIDDDYFTKISFANEYVCLSLNKPSIFLSPNEDLLANISYTLYSDRKRRASTIRKEIDSEIKKKYGNFFKADLSIIK